MSITLSFPAGTFEVDVLRPRTVVRLPVSAGPETRVLQRVGGFVTGLLQLW